MDGHVAAQWVTPILDRVAHAARSKSMGGIHTSIRVTDEERVRAIAAVEECCRLLSDAGWGHAVYVATQKGIVICAWGTE